MPHLTNIREKLKELHTRKWSADWSELQHIQNRIARYERLLAQGIEFEPAF